jgi:hypothetical protein
VLTELGRAQVEVERFAQTLAVEVQQGPLRVEVGEELGEELVDMEVEAEVVEEKEEEKKNNSDKI